MSDSVNSDLMERAIDVQAYFEGTDLELAIANNIERQDLDMVKYLVEQGEAEISRQEFHNNDNVPEREVTDVY